MRKNRSLRLLSVLCAVGLLFCTGCQSSAPEPERIQVIATVFPQYDFARTIAGEYADVTLLLSAGQEMHNYEPTPLDVADISQCDIFLRIGGESEVWTETLLEALDTSRMDVVTLMDCIEAPLAEEEHHHNHGHDEHEEGEADDHETEFDEHIWNSPVNAIAMVQEVTNALCRADAAHEAYFRQNAADYMAELEKLDESLRALTADMDSEPTLVIADKFPFRYLAAEYGFHYAAAFSGCSSETEPTVGALHTLTEECAEHGITSVFYLEFSSAKIADRVCNMTGAKSVMLHPLHNISAEDMQNGTSFLTLMTENYLAIKEAIS